MKNLRSILPFGSLFILSTALTWAEAPVPAGSIRPTHKIAKTDLPAAATLPFEAALKSALAAVPGGVIKAELEVEDGTLLYSFEIVGADKSITEVEVDAGNGKVLAMEKEAPKAEKKSHQKHEHKVEQDEEKN